jgi:hypothetical protein
MCRNSIRYTCVLIVVVMIAFELSRCWIVR